jgi:hypothetical protein
MLLETSVYHQLLRIGDRGKAGHHERHADALEHALKIGPSRMGGIVDPFGDVSTNEEAPAARQGLLIDARGDQRTTWKARAVLEPSSERSA